MTFTHEVNEKAADAACVLGGAYRAEGSLRRSRTKGRRCRTEDDAPAAAVEIRRLGSGAGRNMHAMTVDQGGHSPTGAWFGQRGSFSTKPALQQAGQLKS